MPKIDRLKEELATQKQLFFVSLAIIFALTGWVVANSDKPTVLLTITVIAIIFSGFFCKTRYVKMGQLLEEIEDA